jgi:hypothetical protein
MQRPEHSPSVSLAATWDTQKIQRDLRRILDHQTKFLFLLTSAESGALGFGSIDGHSA